MTISGSFDPSHFLKIIALAFSNALVNKSKWRFSDYSIKLFDFI